MKAVELIDGHLPRLERGFFLILGELADHQVPGENLLVGQARSIDGTKAKDVVAAAREPLVVCLDGVVAELVVEAIIADGGGKLGRVAEAVFPDLGKEVVEGFAAGCDVAGGLRRRCILRH